jgi:hypothetical protein
MSKDEHKANTALDRMTSGYTNTDKDFAELLIDNGGDDFSHTLNLVLRRIDDQSWLKFVAVWSKYPNNSLAAVNRLTDIGELLDVANSSRWQDTRNAANEKANDPQLIALFFKEQLQADNWRELLDRIKDEAILADLASWAIENHVIQEFTIIQEFTAAVMSKITDQEFLYQIAVTDSNPKVIELAVEGLTNLNLLKKLATEKQFTGKSLYRVADRLNDQDLLYKVASMGGYGGLGAAEKITRPDLVKALAFNEDADSFLRGKVIRKLDDPHDLEELLLTEKDYSNRKILLEMMPELSPSFAEELIANSDHSLVILLLSKDPKYFKSPQGQQCLAKFAIDTEGIKAFKQAIEVLTDEKLLEQLLGQASEKYETYTYNSREDSYRYDNEVMTARMTIPQKDVQKLVEERLTSLRSPEQHDSQWSYETRATR